MKRTLHVCACLFVSQWSVLKDCRPRIRQARVILMSPYRWARPRKGPKPSMATSILSGMRVFTCKLFPLFFNSHPTLHILSLKTDYYLVYTGENINGEIITDKGRKKNIWINAVIGKSSKQGCSLTWSCNHSEVDYKSITARPSVNPSVLSS